MKIVQVLPTFAYGDAIGNDVIAIYYALKNEKIETAIYAEDVDRRIKLKGVKSVSKLNNDIKKNDIVIYHLSTGTDLNYRVSETKGHLIVRYHNITPGYFFEDYNVSIQKVCDSGRDGLAFLSNKAKYALADSEYNKKELIEAGYKCEIDVVPVLIPFDDYRKNPDIHTMDKYTDGKTNILFTGRIAPNKKQEDIIRSFYYYKKYYNNNSRLIFVGNYNGFEPYYDRLCKYVDKLELKDVVFTGHIKFEEILSFYNIADVFVCMSEHEGFCVPLVEAMEFGIPVIAHDSSAISDTLGEGGILLKEKNAIETAAMINRICVDETLRQQIYRGQKARLHDFEYDIIKKELFDSINKFMEITYE